MKNLIEQVQEPELMTKTREERKTALRGVVRCKGCLWYIGNNMLRDTDGICPICENEVKEEA